MYFVVVVVGLFVFVPVCVCLTFSLGMESCDSGGVIPNGRKIESILCKMFSCSAMLVLLATCFLSCFLFGLTDLGFSRHLES